MTILETAAAFRRLADGLEKVVKRNGDGLLSRGKPALDGDAAVGGAIVLCWIRDLVTNSNRETWDRSTLLVMLETISRDAEVFPCGVASTMWQCDDEDEDCPTSPI